MDRRRCLALLTVGATLALSACTAGVPETSVPTPPTANVGALPTERVAGDVPLQVAQEVIPPTNRWYSSLAFSRQGLPVYPFPTAFVPRETGFAFAVPTVTAGAMTIGGSFTDGLEVMIGATGALTREVTRADPVSVTLSFRDDQGPVAAVTLAEGSPIVALHTVHATTLSFPGALTPVGGAWSLDGGRFVVVAPGASVDGAHLDVTADAAVQLAALPEGADPRAWADALGDPLDGVSVTSAADTDTSITTLRYAGTSKSVVVPFPGMTAMTADGGDASCDLGSYTTPYGTVDACRGTQLERRAPLLSPAARYDPTAFDDATRRELVAQVRQDVDDTGPLPSDTYFGGKALARLASLHELAATLGADDLASSIADRLATEIAPWLETDGCRTRTDHCFVYDDHLRLVVGKTVSFGSESGNDHHFHYGYFLYAAGVLGAARPDLVETLRPVMTLLAADIVTGSADGALPALRTFDPYRGHSWASGPSPFADGNNQESSSEAVAAWNGVALWAQTAHDTDLLSESTWLLSSEADAARRLWLEPDGLAPGYAHRIVSLTWSSKRDYATWFSPEPSAILGIQLLPLGPVSLDYLAADPQRVAENIADAGDGAFTGPLGDYVRAYSALEGDSVAGDAAADLGRRTEFDDGWSKALALAWVAAVRHRQQ